MSGELTLLIVCCGWPAVWLVGGWWLRGMYEKRRQQQP